MRKKYHFRHSPQGQLAWDVDRLIALTAGLQIEALPLGQIRELDEPYWYESGGALPTCRSVTERMRLAQTADLGYPIIVCPQGRIMDGMHRVVKAWLKGRDCIDAYRLLTLQGSDLFRHRPDAGLLAIFGCPGHAVPGPSGWGHSRQRPRAPCQRLQYRPCPTPRSCRI